MISGMATNTMASPSRNPTYVPGEPVGAANRRIEEKVSELDGHKSLYSESFYTEDDFALLYGGDHYTQIKKRYDPDSRLLDLYSKAVQRK